MSASSVYDATLTPPPFCLHPLRPRRYKVDGDNLAPSADTVLIDNSYLPAAFTTDFGSAPWTLTSPFKETCSVRVANMTATQFTASGER